jgi:hypothetical protein
MGKKPANLTLDIKSCQQASMNGMLLSRSNSRVFSNNLSNRLRTEQLERRLTTPANSPTMAQSSNGGRSGESYSPMPFNIGADEVLFNLGSSKYLIINKTDGSKPATRFRIADLACDPTKKRKVIRLSLQQWVDLGYWVDDVNQMISQQDSGDTSYFTGEIPEGRVNLGGNVYISLKRGLPGMDFRWFWLPPDDTVDLYEEPQKFNVHPTKHGIWITYVQWQELVRLMPIVHKLVPELEGMTFCAASHDGQKGSLQCAHCNPNGYRVWM